MNLKTWHITGMFFTFILGVLLHFTYHWSGGRRCVALFSAANESVWEHQKLIAMPFFLFSAIEYAVYGKTLPNFFAVKLTALLIGILTTIGLFYSYTSVLKQNYLPLDIGTFSAGAMAAYSTSLYGFRHGLYLNGIYPALAGPLLLVILLLFFLFTFCPPKLPLFRDSSTGKYGVPGERDCG